MEQRQRQLLSAQTKSQHQRSNNPFRQRHPQMQHNQRTEEHQKSPSPTNFSSNTHSKSNALKHSSKLGGRKHIRKNRVSPWSKGSRNDNLPRSCMHHPGPLHLESNIGGGRKHRPTRINSCGKRSSNGLQQLAFNDGRICKCQRKNSGKEICIVGFCGIQKLYQQNHL
jgi:hypothetical protein